ncbi:MAG: hypothetical protein ACI8O8_002046 [Oleiphilaceae bacterium]|jgi:hypothetical protein
MLEGTIKFTIIKWPSVNACAIKTQLSLKPIISENHAPLKRSNLVFLCYSLPQ